MDIVQSIILGALQGVTEFIPVSSSGHLLVLRTFMGLEEIPVLFDILLHVPTLLAIVIVFRKKIIELAAAVPPLIEALIKHEKAPQKEREAGRLISVLLVATAATALLGAGIEKLKDYIPVTPKISGILFIITGLILIATRFMHGNKEYNQIGIREGIVTGIGQGIGVLPGISRSGITIAASLFSGMKRENAGEYSFLLAIPAILGALLLKMNEAGSMHIAPHVLVISLLVSFVTGLLSLILLIRLVKKSRLYFFSIYLIPAGVLTIIFA
ncbi:MAG: undecaprenyl-diphosphate phosphatase [Spirochaetales bacterium]|nr:undecaprenyl-diphosphate phosphatase [Spirochaetales bacterium]